tara:strand:+ start:677 stop:1270 length:594 start_codon:yes stop_codon:yes gene_type:complete
MSQEMSQYKGLDYKLDGIDYHQLAMVDKDNQLHTQNSSAAEIREAYNFKKIVESYLDSKEGKSLVKYLNDKNHQPREIFHYGAGPLGKNTVAAVAMGDLEANILTNYQDGKGFSARVREFVDTYQKLGINLQYAEGQEYILAHELAHLAGYITERSAEGALANIYGDMAKAEPKKGKYNRLTQVAKIRKEQAKKKEN